MFRHRCQGDPGSGSKGCGSEDLMSRVVEEGVAGSGGFCRSEGRN